MAYVEMQYKDGYVNTTEAQDKGPFKFKTIHSVKIPLKTGDGLYCRNNADVSPVYTNKIRDVAKANDVLNFSAK